MTSYLLVKYLHYISLLGMVSALAAEAALLKNAMTRRELNKLSRVDALYGVLAIAVVAAGLTLWFGVGKGEAFYNNPVLHLKVGIVVVVGLISIVPTVFYLKQRKGDPQELVQVPQKITRLVWLQLALLALVPLLAVLMAHGVRF